MRKKITIYFMTGVLSAMTLLSCVKNETEELFDKSATDRVKDQKDNLRSILKSSEQGWKLVYSTDPTIGYSTFVFKFPDDKNVEMLSDVDSKGDKVTSEYNILLGSTVKLSFSTKTKIHELSDSYNSPNRNLRGKGRKGDFEFLYYGKDGEDLIFKSNRDFKKEIRFIKASAKDWESVAKSVELLKKFEETPESKGFPFRFLVIKNEIYYYSFNKLGKYFTITDAAKKTSTKHILSFDGDKATVSPPILVSGKVVKKMMYDSTTGNIYGLSDNEESLLTIENRKISMKIPDGYKNFRKGRNLFLLPMASWVKTVHDNSSEYFKNSLKSTLDVLKKGGLGVSSIYYYRGLKKDTSVFIIRFFILEDPKIVYRFAITVEKSIKENILYLKFLRADFVDSKIKVLPKLAASVSDSYKKFKPLWSLFLDKKGYYVNDEGNLRKLSGEPYSNKVFSLRSLESPLSIFWMYDSSREG